MVCTGCCATLDHIVTYLFKQVMMKGKVRRGQMLPDNDALVQVIKLRPEILQQMLQVRDFISLKKYRATYNFYLVLNIIHNSFLFCRLF